MIYVITHKEFDDTIIDKNDYAVLHVGPNDNCKSWYLRDDTGENISFKNANYCELTGLYWIWKNIKEESDVVGLVHYRRYFTDSKSEKIYRRGGIMPVPISMNSAKLILHDSDIILPVKKHTHRKVKETYIYFHCQEDYDVMRNSITAVCPEYIDSFDNMMNSHDYCYANMFISSKNVMDRYTEWLFLLLNEIEHHIDLSSYADDYQRRVFGFMSERLLQVWVEHNNLTIFECPVFNTEDRGETFLTKNAERIKRYLGHGK